MRQLKTFLSVLAIAVFAISIIGAPVSYHECFFRSDHHFHSPFFEQPHGDHCECCEDTHQDSCCDNHHHDATCDAEQHLDKNTPQGLLSFAHATCCQLKSVFLELIAVAKETVESVKELFSTLVLFFNDLFHDWIDIARYFLSEIKHHAPPNISQNIHAATSYIDTQFLL